jgi:4-hydroxy-tetrahydrodipicolinate reductase
MDRMYCHFVRCIENGLNVITPSEEALYPWGVSPELTASLDKLAKKHGVTVTASGAQDSFRVNILALLTGASQTIESIFVRQIGNLSQLGPESIKNYHIGNSKEEFNESIREKGVLLFSLKICLEALIADLGLTIKTVEQRMEPIIAETDIPAKGVIGGIVKKDLVAGMNKIIDVETEQATKIHGEQMSRIFHRDEKGPTSLSECFIKGKPELHLKIQAIDSEANSTAVASLVNRIPDIINSEPGYVTIEKLAKLKFRAFPLQYYLNR